MVVLCIIERVCGAYGCGYCGTVCASEGLFLRVSPFTVFCLICALFECVLGVGGVWVCYGWGRMGWCGVAVRVIGRLCAEIRV